MSTSTSRRAMITVAGVVAAGGIATGAAIAATGANAESSGTAKSGSSSGSSAAPKLPAGAPAPGGGPGGGPAGPGGGKYDADGTVTSASSSSLTVRNEFGKSSTYALTSATKVHSGPGSSASRSDLDPGDRVHVHGAKTSSGVRATDVDIHVPHLGGSVSGVSGSSITVTDHDGFTRTIDTSSSTKYTVDGKSASRSAVTSGRVVQAEGSVDTDGTTLDATRVVVLTKQPSPPAPPANAPKPPNAHSKAPSSTSSGRQSGSSSAAPSNGSGRSS